MLATHAKGSEMFPNDADVLIVGAGPTGLALAITLQQAGIRHVVVDKLSQGQNTSRAAEQSSTPTPWRCSTQSVSQESSPTVASSCRPSAYAIMIVRSSAFRSTPSPASTLTC